MVIDFFYSTEYEICRKICCNFYNLQIVKILFLYINLLIVALIVIFSTYGLNSYFIDSQLVTKPSVFNNWTNCHV